jgi:PAS domain S-box-containing protein
MAEKPSYGELEQRIIKLEREACHRISAEQALLKSEEKYSKLFQHSNDGIFIHDMAGSIIDANKKILDLLAYTKPEIASIKIPLLHPVEAQEKSKWAFETIVKEGFVNFEIDFLKKTGEILPAEVSSSLFKIGDKQVIQGIVRDISDRKFVESERECLIDELQKTISEVKILRRFLPICASCKKIRDDEGYWTQIEEYIHAHTDARFSHGICPDCAKKLYPEVNLHP